MELLVEQEDGLRTLQRESPERLFVTGFAVYFVACFVPGTNGKALFSGWLFGILAGTVLINGASTVAALLMFYVARRYLRSHIESRYAVHLPNIRKRIESEGGAYLFALRLIPFMPYATLNVLMGITPIRARTFWWATQLGLLPSNFVYAWVGASLPGLRDLQRMEWTELMSWELVSALLLLAMFPLLAKYVARIAKARRT
jgi:uncharacterized membrane protein YdjX (TVP38/TMEM64 family)